MIKKNHFAKSIEERKEEVENKNKNIQIKFLFI